MALSHVPTDAPFVMRADAFGSFQGKRPLIAAAVFVLAMVAGAFLPGPFRGPVLAFGGGGLTVLAVMSLSGRLNPSPVMAADEEGVWLKVAPKQVARLAWEELAHIRLQNAPAAYAYLFELRDGRVLSVTAVSRRPPDEILAELYRLSRGRVRIG